MSEKPAEADSQKDNASNTPRSFQIAEDPTERETEERERLRRNEERKHHEETGS